MQRAFLNIVRYYDTTYPPLYLHIYVFVAWEVHVEGSTVFNTGQEGVKIEDEVLSISWCDLDRQFDPLTQVTLLIECIAYLSLTSNPKI